jgi:transposase
MKKRTYRTIAIEELKVDALVLAANGGRIVFAIDVAKVAMVAAFVAEGGHVLATVRWTNPGENGQVLAALTTLRERGIAVEVAMEPSAAYGDVLRHLLHESGFPVFRVSGKRTHDAAEVYDGVPSLHDAKSAAIIAKLHTDGASAPWPPVADERRRLQAAIATMVLHQDHHLRLIHQAESWLARHWPELTTVIELTSATLLALLARIGGPREVAADVAAASKLLHGMSHGLLSAGKIGQVVECARTSAGVPMIDEELSALQVLAGEAHRALREYKKAKRRVEELGQIGAASNISQVTGKATAAVLVSDVGDPRGFSSCGAYLKAYGLNLKEKSSGSFKGRLMITKRGPSRARQFLWLAACRLLQSDRVTRAWYDQKVKRDGGKKARAVVGVMRKLAKALFHVARGAPLDTTKLFDVSRLELAA